MAPACAPPLPLPGSGSAQSGGLVTDSLAIPQILEHLDLRPPEKPPPDIRDVVRVPVDEEGREIEA
jgi:hypothetical protein